MSVNSFIDVTKAEGRSRLWSSVWPLLSLDSSNRCHGFSWVSLAASQFLLLPLCYPSGPVASSASHKKKELIPEYYYKHIGTEQRFLHLVSAGAAFSSTWNWVPYTHPLLSQLWKVALESIQLCSRNVGWDAPANFLSMASVKLITFFTPRYNFTTPYNCQPEISFPDLCLYMLLAKHNWGCSVWHAVTYWLNTDLKLNLDLGCAE